MTTTQTPVDARDETTELLAWFDESGGFNQGTKAPHKWVLRAEQELRRNLEASARALAAIPEKQAGGVPAGWRKGMEVAASILESNAGPATRKAAADGLRNLLAASPSPSAVQPLSEAQIEDLHGEANRGFFIEKEDYFKAFRDAERAHGIVTKESSNAS